MPTNKRKHARSKRRSSSAYEDIFVANDNDTFTCGPCLTPKEVKALGNDDVEVWNVGSDGWTAPVVCHRCKMSIPVVVDGNKGLGLGYMQGRGAS